MSCRVTTTTPRPATFPTKETRPGAAARTGSPTRDSRSTPRCPARQGSGGGSQARTTRGRRAPGPPATGHARPLAPLLPSPASSSCHRPLPASSMVEEAPAPGVTGSLRPGAGASEGCASGAEATGAAVSASAAKTTRAIARAFGERCPERCGLLRWRGSRRGSRRRSRRMGRPCRGPGRTGDHEVFLWVTHELWTSTSLVRGEVARGGTRSGM